MSEEKKENTVVENRKVELTMGEKLLIKRWATLNNLVTNEVLILNELGNYLNTDGKARLEALHNVSIAMDMLIKNKVPVNLIKPGEPADLSKKQP